MTSACGWAYRVGSYGPWQKLSLPWTRPAKGVGEATSGNSAVENDEHMPMKALSLRNTLPFALHVLFAPLRSSRIVSIVLRRCASRSDVCGASSRCRTWVGQASSAAAGGTGVSSWPDAGRGKSVLLYREPRESGRMVSEHVARPCQITIEERATNSSWPRTG